MMNNTFTEQQTRDLICGRRIKLITLSILACLFLFAMASVKSFGFGFVKFFHPAYYDPSTFSSMEFDRIFYFISYGLLSVCGILCFYMILFYEKWYTPTKRFGNYIYLVGIVWIVQNLTVFFMTWGNWNISYLWSCLFGVILILAVFGKRFFSGVFNMLY